MDGDRSGKFWNELKRIASESADSTLDGFVLRKRSWVERSRRTRSSLRPLHKNQVFGGNVKNGAAAESIRNGETQGGFLGSCRRCMSSRAKAGTHNQERISCCRCQLQPSADRGAYGPGLRRDDDKLPLAQVLTASSQPVRRRWSRTSSFQHRRPAALDGHAERHRYGCRRRERRRPPCCLGGEPLMTGDRGCSPHRREIDRADHRGAVIAVLGFHVVHRLYRA